MHDQGIISQTNQLSRIEFLLKLGIMDDRTVVYVSLPKKYWRQPPTSDANSAPCTRLPRKFGQPLGLERLARSVPPQATAPTFVYNPEVPSDSKLTCLMKTARQQCKQLSNNLDKVDVIAHMVSKHMGGPVDLAVQHEENVQLYLSFVKRRMGSSCVPLGEIGKGNELHRALLFKVGFKIVRSQTRGIAQIGNGVKFELIVLREHNEYCHTAMYCLELTSAKGVGIGI